MRTGLTFQIIVGWAVLRSVSSFVALPTQAPTGARSVFVDEPNLVVVVSREGHNGVPLAIDANATLSQYPLLHAEISDLVRRRGQARWSGDYARADAFRAELDEIVARSGFSLRLADLPRSQGGGSTWNLVRELPMPVLGASNVSKVLHLAHSALGMAVSYSDRGMVAPVSEMNELVKQAKQQLVSWDAIHTQFATCLLATCLPLRDDGSSGGAWSASPLQLIREESSEQLSSWYSVESGLRGRKAADAAFWFALAGCHDNELFHLLTRVCMKELARFGMRPSCRPTDVLSVAHRLAAAGVRNDAELEESIKRCLAAKGWHDDFAGGECQDILDMHASASTLLLWKFSKRQKKQKSFLLNAATHWRRNHCTSNSGNQEVGTLDSGRGSALISDWRSVFADPTRPLVVDVGCGMGVSLLGLASMDREGKCSSCSWGRDCNYLGVDLSPVAIGFAKGVASRWNLDRLAFIVGPSEQLLMDLKSYTGPVRKILIQFPTPYRLATTESGAGNAHLPSSAIDGFMVTKDLLNLSHSLLSRAGSGDNSLLIQSNCEDVAVWMRNLACSESQFEVVVPESSVLIATGEMTRRTRNWIDQEGERAIGPGWCASAMLPRRGQTETEVACDLNGIPVHRVVLRPTRTVHCSTT